VLEFLLHISFIYYQSQFLVLFGDFDVFGKFGEFGKFEVLASAKCAAHMDYNIQYTCNPILAKGFLDSHETCKMLLNAILGYLPFGHNHQIVLFNDTCLVKLTRVLVEPGKYWTSCHCLIDMLIMMTTEETCDLNLFIYFVVSRENLILKMVNSLFDNQLKFFVYQF